MGGIDDTAVEKLATEFAGELLRQGDAGYDEAREVYNAMFSDRWPALIARCRSTADVVAAVKFGRSTGVEVAVRAGGHSIAGFSTIDDGLLIDLSPMKHIDVDADGRIARAQPGVLLGELDAETLRHGLATPLGFVSVTGIAGLTLNGGIGFLTRKHGLSCDNLLAAEVVLADGSVVTASDDENADLMWGLRGGGGNFGIVTRFEYRLHEVSDVYIRMSFYEPAALRDILRVLATDGPGLSEDVVAYAGSMTIPEIDMFPPEVHGKTVAMLLMAYLGGEEGGPEALAALPTPPSPLVDMAMPMPFQMAQTMQDEDLPSGRRNYWKSANFTELTDEAIDVIADGAFTATSPHTTVGIMPLGGAVSRVGETDTAYCGRGARFNLMLDNIWEDPAEDAAQIAWSRAFFDALTPFFSEGAYLNFTVEEDAGAVARAYGPNYSRLVDLKNTYDPSNFFRRNQNITPAG
ncbi:MAG: FAD-binding oxidoreductase [Actinobacteria bacterium]|nr:FAD-binding oxidoreductase [Actinomycetota bacterium]